MKRKKNIRRKRFYGIRKSYCIELLALCVLSSAWSCSENQGDYNNSTENQESLIKSLNDDLKSFNITYQKVINSSQKQRNNSFSNDFWDDLGTVLTVAGADIVGAGMGVWASKEIAGVVGLATGGAGGAAVCIAGGVIAGAGASVETVRHLSSENIDGFISQGISHRTTIAQLDIEYPKEYNYLKMLEKNIM